MRVLQLLNFVFCSSSVSLISPRRYTHTQSLCSWVVFLCSWIVSQVLTFSVLLLTPRCCRYCTSSNKITIHFLFSLFTIRLCHAHFHIYNIYKRDNKLFFFFWHEKELHVGKLCFVMLWKKKTLQICSLFYTVFSLLLS